MPDRSVDVLLVGGGVAAVRCARTLRRRRFDGSILLVGDEPELPYNRPPLSKELLRGEAPIELTAAEPATWYERHAVATATGVSVVSLDPRDRVAELADGSHVRFARCLLAPGAAPRQPPIPGAEHAMLLRTLRDSIAIRERARAGQRAVVIGGGFIGVEVASSLTALGMRVTVLEMSPELWAGSLGEEVSAWAIEALAAAGVDVRLSTAATRLEADAARVGDERLPADLIVAGVGVTPRTDMAIAAGLTVDDGIVCSASHVTSAPDVYAAGDAARVDGVRVEHWHAAREGGERAALAMLDEKLPPRRAPWIFSEFAGQHLDVVGLATRWDETRVVGDRAAGRFAHAFVRQGVVEQLAVVNDAVQIEAARAFVERRPPVAELESLVESAVA
jgi:3-phenylpropionate/trans-cinnamate dioxygenase ferredoxin reductase component